VYRLIFTIVVRRLPTEFAHHGWCLLVRWGSWLAPLLRKMRLAPSPDPSGAIRVWGLEFAGPLGLAAGMDKNVTVVRGHIRLGFSHVEVGTITPKGQPGNEKPRAWREVKLRAVRNRMGFNNKGAKAAARHLARLRRSRSGRRLIIGVNIGKNRTTTPEAAAADYAACATALAPYADFIVVNVSSPNTPGLRDLQATESLRPILTATREAADASARKRVPLLVKIAPDLADEQVDAIARLVLELGLEGVEATNTTISHDLGPGGLSGPPLFPRALEVVARLRRELGPEPVIIGMGGITTVEDARAMLGAGATLLQGYTALIYEGPAWPGRLNAALTRPRRIG
jgi:dihydroorotate dehydrogenase